MGLYIETLILYVVLFFTGSIGSGTLPEGFSISNELWRIFTYSIPALALIWYLLLKAKKNREWGIKPGKNDLISCIITFPCLFITGFTVSLVSSFIGGTEAEITLYSPTTALGWALLCISCIAAAYLEESFFRFYIISRREDLKLSATYALVFSTALFSICHLYEGPWGFLNAALSGAFLGFIFLRYRAIHGISLAHAMYNITVYVINANAGYS